MEVGNANLKRRRFSSQKSNMPEDEEPYNIEDLPIAILANNVGQYLTNTARALFAVAMSASSSSWEACNWSRKPTPTSLAIVAAGCQIKEYYSGRDPWGCYSSFPARKLTDGELGGFLVCTDAVNNLQRLSFLDCCNSITGSGLVPLKGSTVLQQIDCGNLDENFVIPILHSILDKGETMSLVCVQWQKEMSEMVNHFMERFEKCLNQKGLSCSSCKGVCKGNAKDPMVHLTCYQCLKHCCIECKYHPDKSSVLLCNECDICYCEDCGGMKVCDACNVSLCRDCNDSLYSMDCCTGCDLWFCRDGCEGGNESNPRLTMCNGSSCKKIMIDRTTLCKNCMDDTPFIHCDICDMRGNNYGGYYVRDDGVCEDCALVDGFEPCTECNRTICFNCGTKECNTEIVHKCFSCTKKAHRTLLDRLNKIEDRVRDRGYNIQQLIGDDI